MGTLIFKLFKAVSDIYVRKFTVGDSALCSLPQDDCKVLMNQAVSDGAATRG